MRNLLKLGSIAVLLAASAIPALAQDSSSSSSSEASSSMASTSSSSVEQTGATVNYGNVISAIQAGKNADLTTITDSSTINIVLVSDLKANGDANALDNALKKNADAADTLKANVETNATLKAKLTAGGYTNDQVVAVLAETDGSFTVVVNDQHP
jgi:hypothetical protein